MADGGGVEKGCYTEHGVSGYGVAVKLSRPKPMADVFIREMAEEMMLAIARKCEDHGARCIGHIKSHIRTDAGTLKADTIGVSHGAHSSGSLAYQVSDLFMAVNSIVQGVKEEAVKAATLEGIHEVAEGHGLSVVKEKEHTYFDEFDFMPAKRDYLRKLEEQVEEQLEEDVSVNESKVTE